MALPGLYVAAIRHFCEQRVPPHAPHQVRVEADISPTAVTIVELRAPWRSHYGPERTRGDVARLRFVAKHKHWVLYWPDRNQKWHLCDLLKPSPDVLVLLDEIERDPTCIFWG